MAKLDFSKITPDNGALHEVAELIFLQMFTEESPISKFVTAHFGVHTGDKLAGVGEFGPMGTSSTTVCGGDYKDSMISTQQKEWALGRWEIREKICIDAIESTLVKMGLKSGTDVADLQGSDYLDKILVPLLEKAVVKAIWRIIWLGDTAAANITVTEGVIGGGTITAGVNLSLFDMCDGLFKKLTAITAANPKQRVVIAPNAQTTYALQRAELAKAGVAQKIFDDAKDAMSAVLKQNPARFTIVTDSLATALARDIRDSNKGSDLQWEAIFAGIEMTKYDGETIFKVAMFDEMFAAFCDTGTYVINPHRLITTVPDNLLMGTSSTEAMAELKSWFDLKEDMNYIKMLDTVGTEVWQDDLVVYGY